MNDKQIRILMCWISVIHCCWSDTQEVQPTKRRKLPLGSDRESWIHGLSKRPATFFGRNWTSRWYGQGHPHVLPSRPSQIVKCHKTPKPKSTHLGWTFQVTRRLRLDNRYERIGIYSPGVKFPGYAGLTLQNTPFFRSNLRIPLAKDHQLVFAYLSTKNQTTFDQGTLAPLFFPVCSSWKLSMGRPEINPEESLNELLLQSEQVVCFSLGGPISSPNLRRVNHGT